MFLFARLFASAIFAKVSWKPFLVSGPLRAVVHVTIDCNLNKYFFADAL